MTNALLSALVNGAIVAALLAAAATLSLLLVPRSVLGAGARCAIWSTVLVATVLLPLAYLPMRPVNTVAHFAEPLHRPLAASTVNSPAIAARPLNRHASRAVRWPLPLVITADVPPRLLTSASAILSAVFLLRLLASLCLLSHRKSGAVPAPAELARRVEASLVDHRSPRRAAVLSSATVTAPVLAGLHRPAILIPERLLTELSEDELIAVALHEAAHLARRDDYALLAERLVRATFPLHPVVWWILRQKALEREMACDDFVVDAMGSPRRYAACLIRVMELCSGAQATWAAAGMAAVRSQFARRVDTLLDANRQTARQTRKLRLLTAAAVIAAFACLAVRTPRAIAFSTPPAPPKPPSVAPAPPPALPAIPPAAPAQAPAHRAAPPAPPAPPKPQAAGPPLSVVLVVDRSGSMRSKDALVDAAVTGLIHSANTADEFLLVTFSDAVDVAGPFANDTARILQELHRDTPRGGTSLRDAILRAVQWNSARYPNRVLVVISDGNDNTSSISPTQLLAAVVPAQVPVWAITLAPPRNYARPSSRWLEDLAAQTRGREFVTDDPKGAAAAAHLVQ